ncbi:MAG: asparaginase [Gaiellaceae bacterium]
MASNPIRVVVRRGGVAEATHLVHAVAVQDGRRVAEAGDPSLVTLFRSSAKPFQALPLAEAYDDIDARELAIASASHCADREQLSAVRMLLGRAHAGEDDLECGREGHPPSRLKHNCSGKHAGMLAVCRAHGWRTEGYRLPSHRMQRTNLANVAAAARIDEDGIATAVDGCGVPTFALSLEQMADVFTRLEASAGGARVADAMRAHPELIRGDGAPDTVVMQTLDGAVAKGGAEGLLCGVLADRTGFAIKSADGAGRALGPAVSSFLARLGAEVPRLYELPVANSRGENVGAIRVE